MINKFTIHPVDGEDDGDMREYFVYHDWMETGNVPWDVTHVKVHPSPFAIRDYTFRFHRHLVNVVLNDGWMNANHYYIQNCQEDKGLYIQLLHGGVNSCYYW